MNLSDRNDGDPTGDETRDSWRVTLILLYVVALFAIVQYGLMNGYIP